MNDKINLTRADGTTIQADLICLIDNTATGKRYLYYTLNETVGEGASSTVKVYVAKIQQGNPSLDTAITEEDWNQLKGYMSDALKGNTNPSIKYVPASELVNPIVVSEKAIAMPISYDYINKQKGIYAQAVATSTVRETPIQAPVQPETPVSTVAEAPSTPPVREPVVSEAQMQVPVEPSVQPLVSEPLPVVPSAPSSVEVLNENQSVSTPLNNVSTQNNSSMTQPTTPEENGDGSDGSSAVLQPIDLASIEAKYNEMIENINKLKGQELEAAKRYNATIELSAMHNEQHASYVQSEQVKDVAPIVQATSPVVDTAQAANPTAQGIVPTAIPSEVVSPQAEPATAVPMTGAPLEPTPVAPIVPNPAPTPMASQDLETNWFDMPNNQ